MTSIASDPLRVESIGANFFRTSFKDGDRDYRDQMQLTPEGIYWVNAYWKEANGEILFVDFGLPGIRISSLDLTRGTPLPFSGSSTGTLTISGIQTEVTASVSGSTNYAYRETIEVEGAYLSAHRVVIDVTMTVSDTSGTLFSREVTTNYAMVDSVGPIAVSNSSSSPAWMYDWSIGTLIGAIPVYGTGYWQNFPPGPRFGYKWTGIGLIDDTNFPWIYHIGEQKFYYVGEAVSTGLFYLWLWDPIDNTWIWTSESLYGWRFNLTPGLWDAWAGT